MATDQVKTEAIAKPKVETHTDTKPQTKSGDQISIDLGYNLDVQPVHYNLSVDLNSETDSFTGKVSIECEYLNDTDWVMINADELKISKVLFDGEVANHENKSKGNLNIDCKGAKKGKHTVEIEFGSEINKKNEGFYISQYGDKKMFSTHFEPTDARKAFPCFDHPKMKATFDITVTADEKYTILSNMPPEKETVENKRKTVQFKRMPKTATYLIAYVVGELQKIQNGRVSVYSTYDVHQGAYALEIGVKVLDFFEKYFKIPYPLEKLDMVAIPEFSMGAMENWGLVTYRETALLFNKEKSSLYQRARIAETVAHELAHQWFGNLVTPMWWDDLWLNEGFATWAASLGCEAIRQSEKVANKEESEDVPAKRSRTDAKKLIDWKPWLTFIAEDLDRGLDADVLESSHSIKVPVFAPEEVNQIFDGISYSKSASLIRMVENILTPEVFREKLSNYLKEYSWSNATSDNLFEFLSDETIDIKKLMNIWTTKIGFPLVTLTENKLKQTRMLLDKDKNEESDWPVPIRVRIMEDGQEDQFKMINFSTEMDVKDILGDSSTNKTIFLNDGGFGFFRSFYDFDSEIFKKIDQMSPVNRLIFVNDQVALGNSRRITLKKMLDLCRKFENEESAEVLDSIVSFLLEMKHVLYNKNEEIIEIIRDLVRNRVDFDLREEKEFEVMKLRTTLVSLAVNHGVEINVPKDCHPMYLISYFIQDFEKTKDFDGYLKLYKESTSETQSRILHAMAMSSDFEIYKKVVDLLLTKEVKQQDKTRLAISAVGNLEFKEYFIHYFEENFDKLNDIMSSSLMMYIVEHTAAWTRDITHFSKQMEKYDLTQYQQPYKRGLEKANFRNEYRKAFLTGMV